jgi:DNA-binding MarR family transcriptional regulator
MSHSDQQTPSFGDAHPATVLLREFLDVTADFERSLGAELSVNPTDLTAMQHLIVAGALTPTALAQRLGLSSGAVTTVIDRLEGLGHVHRAPNPDDRRGTLVVPEPASVGRAMSRIIPMVTEVDRAIRDFAPDEQAVITRYLSQVVTAYRGHAAESEGPRTWRPDAVPEHPDRAAGSSTTSADPAPTTTPPVGSP